MKKITLTLLLSTFLLSVFAQKALISGPMLGYVEHFEALVWAELSQKVKKAEIKYWEKGKPSTAVTQRYEGILQQPFNPIKFVLVGLKLNQTYDYQLVLDGKTQTLPYATSFTTKELWEYRKPAPDFTFLAGSCSYVNDTIYDRPGKPYGSDYEIFDVMGNTPASFCLWLGDNTYTREVDFSSRYGMNYRYSHTRKLPNMQKLWASMSHYATWDDHDYGPNNANKSYRFKAESRQLFQNYWGNPSFGQKGEGIHTMIRYADCEFFMLDDRYFRSDDSMLDSINGKPNPDKRMIGAEQMDWLKNYLLQSEAPFKFVCIGTQAMNDVTPFDALRHYPIEYYDLIDFITIHKIKGVMFMSGDCHHSIVVKKERKGTYPLYDIVGSAFTSGIYKLSKDEKEKLNYVKSSLVEEHNFSKISVSGERGNRRVKVEFVNKEGKTVGDFSVGEKELK
jgi:alkaline phosphatase D